MLLERSMGLWRNLKKLLWNSVIINCYNIDVVHIAVFHMFAWKGNVFMEINETFAKSESCVWIVKRKYVGIKIFQQQLKCLWRN